MPCLVRPRSDSSERRLMLTTEQLRMAASVTIYELAPLGFLALAHLNSHLWTHGVKLPRR